MELRALIVDDEAPARTELRYMLGKIANVKVVGEASSASEALELVGALEYDIVFVDIQMPGFNGLEAAERFKNHPVPPAVVFVTAFSEHAAKAFELDAADYLVKPFTEERLAQTVRKLASRGRGKESQGESDERITIERVPVKTSDKVLLLPIKDIVFVKSKDKEVLVYTYDNVFSADLTLKVFSDRLRNKGFLRVHRSYLVNLNHVEEIIPMFGQSYVLHVNRVRRTKVPVSRRQGKRLKAALGM